MIENKLNFFFKHQIWHIESKKKKYVKFPKRLEKQRKTVSEQSQDQLEPIMSTPITSPMSDE